jgi:hypothetical protein
MEKMNQLNDLDDGLDALMEGDIDLDTNFVWQPRAQPVPTITAHRHQPSRRRAEDHRARGALAGVLDPMPTAGETIHIILPGNVALGDVLWHIVDATDLPGPLHVSTLGFGRAWIHGLLERLQARQITEATICCSDYFAKSDAAEFQEAKELLAPWPVTLMAGRTHAKVGTFNTLSMEGSANLRACRSIENVSITNDSNLAAFHRQWINTLTTP